MLKYSVECSVKPTCAEILPLAMAIVLLNGCASISKDDIPEKGLEASENIAAGESGSAAEKTGVEDAEASEKDPWEGFNRTMFGFNQKVDDYIAEPVTTAYKWVTPEFVQTGIANFYTNTKAINVVLNDVLQGKMLQSAQDTGRFLVNTTIGIGGLFDVATYMGLERHDEDFDQTLAVWGISPGNYLVLPLLGPTTTRGLPGSVVDTAANPVTYIGWPVQALGVLNERANADGALKFIDEAAVDPYVFTRESFLQWRDHMATDGAAKTGANADEFEEELDENVAEQDNAANHVDAAASSVPAASGNFESKDSAVSAARSSTVAEANNQAATQTNKQVPATTISTPAKQETSSAADTLSSQQQGIVSPW